VVDLLHQFYGFYISVATEVDPQAVYAGYTIAQIDHNHDDLCGCCYMRPTPVPLGLPATIAHETVQAGLKKCLYAYAHYCNMYATIAKPAKMLYDATLRLILF